MQRVRVMQLLGQSNGNPTIAVPAAERKKATNTQKAAFMKTGELCTSSLQKCSSEMPQKSNDKNDIRTFSLALLMKRCKEKKRTHH